MFRPDKAGKFFVFIKKIRQNLVKSFTLVP